MSEQRYRKTKYDVGDRIKIAGYDGMTFEIFAVYLDYYRDSKTEYIDGYYDCYCEQDGEYYYAEDDDITLIERPKNVDYKRIVERQKETNNKLNKAVNDALTPFPNEQKPLDIYNKYPDHFLWYDDNLENNKDEGKVKGEEIDELLTELSDINELIRNFGESEYYAERKRKVKDRLRELAEKGQE